MIVTPEVKKVLLTLAKEKKIYLEGNILKVLKAEKDDKELVDYLKTCKDRDVTARKKRLQVTKQVQSQNKDLVAKQKENDTLMVDLQEALEEAKKAEQLAESLRKEAEHGKEKALEDLDLMQKKKQFQLIGKIVQVALWVILGVGLITTVLFAYTLVSGQENPILESTWSNLFGILLTNSFSIVGTIMGVKYATENKE
jgi:hypothetical protein